MTGRRSTSGSRRTSAASDLKKAIREVIAEVAQEEHDRRDPDARRRRLDDRLERFLDGFDSVQGRGRGQREEGEEDDDQDDDDDEGGIVSLLAGLGGGGGRRR